jgi:catalase (peroxidase I)
MGCWDVFCFICGNPCHSMLSGYEEIAEEHFEENNDMYKKFVKELKNLNRNTEWMNKCTMLLIDDKIIHDLSESACNIEFCKKNFCTTYIDKYADKSDFYFTNKGLFGIFIHTDCWKFIKKNYKIDLKYSNLPKLYDNNDKGYYKIFNFSNGIIEKYWEQDFRFSQIVLDKKQYLCSSPLKNDKNIIQIKKNINALKLKNDPMRIGPLVSATFYKEGDIKLGKNKKLWIKKNNKWIEINEKNERIKINIDLKKINKKQENFLNKIPFIGMYNVNPIFIISSEYYRNIYKLELIMSASYKNIFQKNINL